MRRNVVSMTLTLASVGLGSVTACLGQALSGVSNASQGTMDPATLLILTTGMIAICALRRKRT